MISHKSVYIKHSDAEIRVTYEPRKHLENSALIDVEYHLKIGFREISLTRPEFVMMKEIIEDWFTK
jgi:hypothetical protein